MPIFFMYFSVILTSFFAGFATYSKGAFFSEIVRFLFQAISFAVGIVMCIISFIFFSPFHIVGLIFCFIACLRLGATVINSFLH